jgi:serine palmitoyltransferase
MVNGRPSGPKTRLSNGKTMTNLASYNFLNFGNLERIRNKAVDILHDYGVGACGPPGFYGTLGTSIHRYDVDNIDVHTQVEVDIARFLGVEAAIIYAQAFSTISSVIPDFSKRGDIIVADKGVNFAIQKGLQISRSTVRWFEHNDIDDLERVLEEIKDEHTRSRKPLTRRFIVTEGLSENFGDIVDLPRVVQTFPTSI